MRRTLWFILLLCLIAALPVSAYAADGFAVREESVSIGEYPFRLSGTLLMPVSDDPVPAVVLVQGSGATDRDESIYAVKPFRDIAEALSKQGIAVLRYDKRTYAQHGRIVSSPDFPYFTVQEEIIEDVILAANLLKADSRVDPGRIFLLGHSLGASIAPRIITENEPGLFYGMILASGTNKSLVEVIIRQCKESPSFTEREKEKIISEGTAILTMTEEESHSVKFLNNYAYYYWEMLHQPTPAELLMELEMPTLLINGNRDWQVNEVEGRRSWERALDMDAPWLCHYWTDVNHMLMRPDVSDLVAFTENEYKVKCKVAEDITDIMAAFILNTEDMLHEQ